MSRPRMSPFLAGLPLPKRNSYTIADTWQKTPGDRGTDFAPSARMSSDDFLTHRPHIDQVVTYLCRKHHFRKEECEDFRSHVHLKMIEDNYGVFRKFQGRSSLRTYLTTVVSNEMKDYLNHLWGKWRTSAEAKRLGPVAIRLEKLLRDGLSFDEAVQTLQTNHKVEMSWQELYEIWIQLPDRPPRPLIVGDEVPQDLPSPGDRPDAPSEEEEREAVRRKALAALAEAREALPKEDQLILKMKGDGFKAAHIARFLGLDQKPLYRRIEKILKELREELERRGISKRDIDDLFED